MVVVPAVRPFLQTGRADYEGASSAHLDSGPEKVLPRRQGVLECAGFFCARFFEEGNYALSKNVSCSFGDVTELVRC